MTSPLDEQAEKIEESYQEFEKTLGELKVEQQKILKEFGDELTHEQIEKLRSDIQND